MGPWAGDGRRTGIGIPGLTLTRSFRATVYFTARLVGDSIHRGLYPKRLSMATDMVMGIDLITITSRRTALPHFVPPIWRAETILTDSIVGQVRLARSIRDPE